MTYLSDLKKLAQAATPKQWRADKRLVTDSRGDAVAMVNLARPDWSAHADAAYIAACSPERILQLVAVIEAAKEVAIDCRQGGFSTNTYEKYRAALAELEGGEE